MQHILTTHGNVISISGNVAPGQIIRFNALGHFLRVEDRPSNGLGIAYRMRSDGRAERFFF